MELTSNGESSLTMALVLQRHKLGTDTSVANLLGAGLWLGSLLLN
jgi:hypothetical protein